VREILGYDPAEIVGKTPFDLMPPDESSRVAALFEERRRLGLPLVAIDNVNLHRDGRTVILETSAVPIRDAKGDFAGCRGVDRDVTERRRAEADRLRLEQQVHQTQKLESLGVLAGGIAHDFNNILTAILGFAEIALLDLPDGSPARESIDKIEHAARRAADLSRQMLAYSGKGRFVVEPLDLGHVVRDMRPLLEASITKRARLSFDVAEPLPAISADATQLRQIVLNLVTNASEALGDTDGSIDVSIDARDCTPADFGNAVIGAGPDHVGGHYVVLTVADSGSGMDPLVQSRIFEPFFSTKFTGRGLGLSCVAGIVVGHGGVLQLDSVVGRGSRFTIYLPACDAPIPERAPGPPVAGAAQQTPGRILLVDDEESIRALGAAMLRRLGYEPVLAVDGRDAIERCREPGNGIDCVVLDLTMPRMDGEQTLHEIRKINPGLPVVLSSGYTEASLVGRFDGAGFSGFVQKPYKMAELNAAIAAAMGSRPRVRR
jgi:PAS domain S-box-containing protein